MRNRWRVFVEDILDHIDRTLAARPYFPCVLLVHTDVRRLEIEGEQLAQRAGWPQLPVSRMLTDALIDAPVARRSTLASVALDGALAQRRPGPILCYDLALLFEPLLALDPLALLRQWSRSVPVVACWPGAWTGTNLTYAVPEHAHYRLWSATQLCSGCIVPL